jgi:hypothetical protein
MNRSLVIVPLLVVISCGNSGHDSKSHAGMDPSHHGAPARPPAGTAAPHGDHEAVHGGLVLMDGHDHHAELVLDTRGTAHRVYVSDGARLPMPASTFDEVTLTIGAPGQTPELVTMRRADDNTHWIGASNPVPAKGATIGLRYARGGVQLYDIALPVEYVLTGKMPDAAAEQTPPPHGGQLVATSGGYLELVAAADGNFQVWVLDADRKPRPISSARGTVALSKQGYDDIRLVPDGDHLTGRGAAISGHPTARVTIELDGTVHKATFPLHLEKGGSGHH